MEIAKLVAEGLLAEFKGGRVDDTTDLSRPLLLTEGAKSLDIATAREVSVVMWHRSAAPTSLSITLEPYANLLFTDVYTSEKYASITLEQHESSSCRALVLNIGGAHTSYEMLLRGSHTTSILNGAYIATDTDHAAVNVITRHLVSDAKSKTAVKGIAAGKAVGEFRGMVYVAQDAQRTDAEQINRNIEIGGAKILSEPQLEIYADDVKCSHGSTVGQLDEQALYYIRQRGVSRQVAEKMLLEGFIGDIVSKCEVASVTDLLTQAVQDKMLKL